MAATSFFELVVEGLGGHAAMPHLTRDPVLTSAQLVTQLQAIVARETDPLDSAVVSVSSIQGGDACNVIPERMRLRGTLRAMSTPGILRLQKRVAEISSAVAAAHGCRAELRIVGEDYPALNNDAECWQYAKNVASALVGGDKCQELAPVMGGEDFAYFAERVPSCFLVIGVGGDSGAAHGLHHPRFFLDEEALPVGSALHALLATHG